MRISFDKYQGAGNDFILISRATLPRDLITAEIAFLCHRRYGIGADGLMILDSDAANVVRMEYYNADGLPAGLCGNGARCTAAWAARNMNFSRSIHIQASDGMHRAEMLSSLEEEDRIQLSIPDQAVPQQSAEGYFLNTGSPHHIVFVPDPARVDVEKEGARIRHSQVYAPFGTNVNFVRKRETGLEVRTYERGVEAETLSCGTGAVAAALTQAYLDESQGRGGYEVEMPGGKLKVNFEFNGAKFFNVSLEGPATFVFKGEIRLAGK
jgi:diaminopimelate epimerase